MSNERYALIWHLTEFLLVLSLVGLLWSIGHQKPKGFYTARPKS